HSEDIAQDTANPSGCSLKWLDQRRMIVRFNFESAGPAVAHIDDSGIFSWPLNHALAARRQALQMHARRLIGAVLAPHYAEDAQLGERRLPTQNAFDFFVFSRCDAVVFDNGRSNRWFMRGGHRWKFYFRTYGRRDETLHASANSFSGDLELRHPVSFGLKNNPTCPRCEFIATAMNVCLKARDSQANR